MNRKLFCSLLLLLAIVATTVRAADPYPCATTAWTSYTELRMTLNRDRPHAGSWSTGVLTDISGRERESYTNHHGSSTVDGGVVFLFNLAGYLEGTYYGPGGFGYSTGPILTCFQNADCSWPCGNKYLAYAHMYLPTDTTLNFLKMGRPLANTPVSIAYYNPRTDGFSPSNAVTTDSSGKAIFLPPNGTLLFAGEVVNGTGYYNTEIDLYGGTTSEAVIIEYDRPAPTRWTSAPIAGSSNINMTIYWESLANVPGHQDYLFILYDQYGNNAGYAYTPNNYMSVTIAPGTPFYFRIVAWDSSDRMYADSQAWGISAPSSAAMTLGGYAKTLHIEQGEVQLDSSNAVSGDTFLKSNFGTGKTARSLLPFNRNKMVMEAKMQDQPYEVKVDILLKED